MQSLVKKQSAKTGLPPGTLVHIGTQHVDRAQIRAVIYNRERIEEHDVTDPAQCRMLADQPGVTWIDVDGVHDVDLVRNLGQQFGLHPLVLEDIVNTGERSKVLDFGDYLFIILKMVYFDAQEDEISSDQISIILGKDFVLSFSEQTGDEFAAVRKQVRDEKNRLREMGSEYLAYRLMDSIVDSYFFVLERMSERIEKLENLLLRDETGGQFLRDLHNLKRQLLFMRATVTPVKALMEKMVNLQSPLLDPRLKKYWADVCDHTLNVMETMDTLSDMGVGHLEVYLSSIQFRQNDVIRFLTVISTIFLPLTFLVGVWGMNFQHMPEIPWKWGYLMAWSFITCVTLGMLLWFKKKKWL
jgi:magnesium transporter